MNDNYKDNCALYITYIELHDCICIILYTRHSYMVKRTYLIHDRCLINTHVTIYSFALSNSNPLDCAVVVY